jgi:hypothetical protein
MTITARAYGIPGDRRLYYKCMRIPRYRVALLAACLCLLGIPSSARGEGSDEQRQEAEDGAATPSPALKRALDSAEKDPEHFKKLLRNGLLDPALVKELAKTGLKITLRGEDGKPAETVRVLAAAPDRLGDNPGLSGIVAAVGTADQGRGIEEKVLGKLGDGQYALVVEGKDPIGTAQALRAGAGGEAPVGILADADALAPVVDRILKGEPGDVAWIGAVGKPSADAASRLDALSRDGLHVGYGYADKRAALDAMLKVPENRFHAMKLQEPDKQAPLVRAAARGKAPEEAPRQGKQASFSPGNIPDPKPDVPLALGINTPKENDYIRETMSKLLQGPSLAAKFMTERLRPPAAALEGEPGPGKFRMLDQHSTATPLHGPRSPELPKGSSDPALQKTRDDFFKKNFTFFGLPLWNNAGAFYAPNKNYIGTLTHKNPGSERSVEFISHENTHHELRRRGYLEEFKKGADQYLKDQGISNEYDRARYTKEIAQFLDEKFAHLAGYDSGLGASEKRATEYLKMHQTLSRDYPGLTKLDQYLMESYRIWDSRKYNDPARGEVFRGPIGKADEYYRDVLQKDLGSFGHKDVQWKPSDPKLESWLGWQLERFEKWLEGGGQRGF